LFRPIAGHYFAANKLPGTQDQTEGFWRRFVVLTFNRSFTGDPTRDPNVHTRILAAELPAIVSWLVAGAVRLLRQGDYTIPASHAKAIAAWRKDADQVALFLIAETRPLRDDETEHMGLLAAELYSSYVEWARRNGHRPVASNTFGARLRGLGRAAKRTKAGMRYLVALLSVVEKAALGGDEEMGS
jgi:putative DNA primase/helicase